MIKLSKEDLTMVHATAKEVTRYALQAIKVENNRIIATDGRILATRGITRVFEEQKEVKEDKADFLIPSDAFKQIRVGVRGSAHITANGKVNIQDNRGETCVDEPDGTFPDWKPVLDKVEKNKGTRVSISSTTLAKLAKVCKGEMISLRLPEPNEKENIENHIYFTAGKIKGAVVVGRQVGYPA